MRKDKRMIHVSSFRPPRPYTGYTFPGYLAEFESLAPLSSSSQLLVTAGFIWKELYSENSQIAQKWPCEPIRTQYILRLPRLWVEQSRFTPRPETLCCDGPLGTCADLTFISLAFGFIPSKTQMTDHKDTPQLIPVECLNFPRTETINAKRDA